MKKRGLQALLLAAAGAMTISGCSSGGGQASEKPSGGADSVKQESTEPVTLKVYRYSTGMTEDEFNQFIGDPVKKKYPNITLQYIQQAKGNNPEDFVVTGDIPDMFIADQGGIKKFTDLQIVEDLTPFIKKNNFDTGKFDPITITMAKDFSGSGLNAIPFSLNFSGFFYNKDVFDKFAVPYPKDGMTWDELIELGKRIGRNEGGTSYKSLFPNPLTSICMDNGLPYVDPKTNKANLLTDGFKQAFEIYYKLKNIPENMNVPTPTQLFTSGQLAMMSSGVARIGDFDVLYKQGNPVNWDVIAHPVFNEKKGTSVSPAFLLVSKMTKHKDDVFKVISFVTELENQMNMTKQGRLSALKDQQVRDNFGKDIESLKGKNIKGLLALPFTEYVKPTDYDLVVRKYVNQYGDKAARGETDINSAIREAQEAANQEIASLQG